MLNGRGSGENDFTYISSRGCSIIDYCFVLRDDFKSFSNFMVHSMNKLIKMLNFKDNQGISDHSVLTWNLNFDGVKFFFDTESDDTQDNEIYVQSKLDFKKIPEYFLSESTLIMTDLKRKLLMMEGRDQEYLNEIYTAFDNSLQHEIHTHIPIITNKKVDVFHKP